MIKTVKKGKIIVMIKEYTNQLMPNETNHHPLTNAQPNSEPWVTTPQPAFPSVIIQQVPMRSGTAFWSLRITCPSCVSSQFHVHPQPAHWQERIEQKILWLGVNTVPRQQEHQGVINIILIRNQSHCTVTDTRKKTVLSQLKTEQERWEHLFILAYFYPF